MGKNWNTYYRNFRNKKDTYSIVPLTVLKDLLWSLGFYFYIIPLSTYFLNPKPNQSEYLPT